MKIGLDLDHTIYGFPEFFAAFIPAMVAAGHEIYCTSNHTREQWEKRDRRILKRLGIDPDLIDPRYLPDNPVVGPSLKARQERKADVADNMDIVFDDHADKFQWETRTPIFRPPGKLSADRGNLRR